MPVPFPMLSNHPQMNAGSRLCVRSAGTTRQQKRSRGLPNHVQPSHLKSDDFVTHGMPGVASPCPDSMTANILAVRERHSVFDCQRQLLGKTGREEVPVKKKWLSAGRQSERM
eukprot:scaffold58259_cov15-Tisochrysis_lutea.AAC.1